jgi:hypothetical protein
MLKLRKALNGDMFEVSRKNIIPDICTHMNIEDSWKYNFVFMDPKYINTKLNHIEVLSLEVDILLLTISEYTSDEFVDVVNTYYRHTSVQYSPTFPLILTYEDTVFESCIFSLTDDVVKSRFINNPTEYKDYHIRYIIDGENEELTNYTCRMRICQLKLGTDITQKPTLLYVKIYSGRESLKENEDAFHNALMSILENSGYVRVDSRSILNPEKWTKKEYVPNYFIIKNNIIQVSHIVGEYYLMKSLKERVNNSV